MSTPKPGQIRCPTCLRSTPPAAFCTQCGSPIPESARTRPRGLDREELEERIRRRPGENAFRRGGAPDGAGAGYLPFQPEPEDALAARADEGEGQPRIDNLPPERDITRPIDQPVSREWSRQAEPESEPQWPAQDSEVEQEPAAPSVPPPVVSPPAEMEPDPEDAAPQGSERPYEPPAYEDEGVVGSEPPYPPEAYDDVAYGRPEDAYAYPYASGDQRGGGGNALPIIGFVVLCVLALAVGAVLAGLLGGEEPTGQATPSPSAEVSQAPSEQPSGAASAAPSQSGAEGTPQPSDGPVTFPDGALLTIQPCGSGDYEEGAVGRPEENACQVDGSSVSDGQVWAIVVFNGANGSDLIRVRLLSDGQVQNEQEVTLSSVVSCGDDCNGLIYGAHYVELLPGSYEVELSRNGEFADRATFVVEG
jgi:hypothetical protein